MENHERSAIEHHAVANVELRRLYQEHSKLEEQLKKLESRKFLTPEESLLLKALKKRKLHGVDRMMAIVNQIGVDSSTKSAVGL